MYFLLESPQALGIGGQQRRQNLDGDVAANARIASPIHLAHSALADGAGDLYGPMRVPVVRASRCASQLRTQ